MWPDSQWELPIWQKFYVFGGHFWRVYLVSNVEPTLLFDWANLRCFKDQILIGPWIAEWYNTRLWTLEFCALDREFEPQWGPVWSDWAIYWTLGNFSKPVQTISLPKSPSFLDNFCKGHYWATFIDIWQLFTGHTNCLPSSFYASIYNRQAIQSITNDLGIPRQVYFLGG